MSDDAQRSRQAARFLAWLEAVGARDGPGGGDLKAQADILDDTPSIIELAELAAAYAEQAFHRTGGPERSARLHCRRGCSYCCHLPVETSTAEAARALEYARGELNAAEFRALRARIREAARAYPLAPDRPPAQSPPCPFLEDDACLVHPVRPLACRGWNSSDVSACIEAYERGVTAVRVPVDSRIRAVYANASEALLRGLDRAGAGRPAHLVPALAALIEVETI